MVSYIINRYDYPSFRALLAIGLMAMLMSTTDSYLNTASVLLASIASGPLGIKKDEQQVVLVRITNLLIGVIALGLALAGFSYYAVIKFLDVSF